MTRNKDMLNTASTTAWGSKEKVHVHTQIYPTLFVFRFYVEVFERELVGTETLQTVSYI